MTGDERPLVTDRTGGKQLSSRVEGLVVSTEKQDCWDIEVCWKTERENRRNSNAISSSDILEGRRPSSTVSMPESPGLRLGGSEGELARRRSSISFASETGRDQAFRSMFVSCDRSAGDPMMGGSMNGEWVSGSGKGGRGRLLRLRPAFISKMNCVCDRRN